MSDQPTLYLLSQAAELRTALSAQEQALSIDTAERRWLSNLYLANQDAREALTEPMYVDKLLIVAQGATTADLAGSFLIDGSVGHAVFLSTPTFGLERFGSRELALAKVRERLGIEAQRDELLRFVPLRIRNAIPHEPPPALITRPIAGGVLDERRQVIEDYLDTTLKHLLDELLEFPSFKSLLGQLFDSTLGKRFPLANLKALQVITHQAPGAADSPAQLPLRTLSTRTLGETLLERYRQGAWPGGQTHEFVSPGYTALAPDTAVWENTLVTLSSQLPQHLHNRLEAFWETLLDIGQPRRQLFIDALGTRFRAELLHQEQDLNEIGAEDYPLLCGLYPLDRARLGAVTLYTLTVTTGQGSCSPANAFVVRHERGSMADYFLYAAGRLQTFQSQETLLESVRTRLQNPGQNPDWLLGLSLRERAGLRHTTIIDISLAAGELSIFDTLFENIIAKLLDNVSYVLERYRHSDGALALAAAFESALDIRGLIAPRLATLAKGTRWSHRLDLSPSEKPASPTLTRTLRPTLETARHQLASLTQLKDRLSEGLKKRPTLEAFLRSELSNELNRAQLHNLSPDNLYINRYAKDLPRFGSVSVAPTASQRVIDHVLERLLQGVGELAEYATGLFSKTASGMWSRISNLGIEGLNRIVNTLLPDFLGHYLRRQRSIYGELSSDLHEAIRRGLRQEVQLKEMRGALKASALELLDNLLDSDRRDQRPGLHGFIPDAYALTYQHDIAAVPIRLHNCFLLTAHGGLDPEHAGRVLLWTPAQGAESFDSLYNADIELQRRLHDPVERLCLLENTTNAERPGHLPLVRHQRSNRRTYPSLGFEQVQNSLQNNRFNSLLDKALADLGQAVTSGYRGENLHHYLQGRLDDHSTVPMLERAIQAAQDTATHLALPSWLSAARASRQFALAALLDHYRQDAATTDDYHQGIPDIRHTASNKLKGLLLRDFPTQKLDPQQITVWLTPREAPLPLSEPLIDFALRHVDDMQSRSISLASVATALPATLTGDRIKSLIQEAAIGSHHAALLDSFLSPDVLYNAHRRPAFSRHGFWQGLLQAFVQRLRGTLSQTAHGFIKHLLGMPDGVARPPLNGQHIELKPLQLINGSPSATDSVAGFYLIGPRGNRPGPCILFCPQGERAMYQEFASEAALLGELGNSHDLQQQVLERLPRERQAHYTSQRFKTALALGDEPVRGNLFHRLYQDATGLLKQMLGCQNLPGQGSLWNKALAWLKGELQQGATTLLGRLRLPWLVWQSLSQLKDAGQKAWQGRWGEAIEEFVMTLAKLAMARRGWVQSNLGGVTRMARDSAVESPFPLPPWGAQRLTPGQKALLLGLQAQQVALEHMTPSRAGDLYTDPATRKTFVAIDGRVFQARQEHQRWRVVTDSAKGPWLHQDDQGQWTFDLPNRCIEGIRDEDV